MNVLMKSDCRKFSPNIFNKSKCQNCFRTKEAHTAEALECNRATRKIAKCGYLFVAPDWDFSVSINRTKRWQRRWFVLYDDGELTYSVDEHPNTIPQALIDMNKVVEVSDAEQVTGNQFSLAITAPERVHFVKGTSRDETKWWYDVLSHYPHGTVRGRHKRNVTFPGINTTSNTTSTTNNIVCNQQEQIVTTVTDRYSRSQSISDTVMNNNNINNKLSGGVELQWSPLVSNSGGEAVVREAEDVSSEMNIETVRNGGRSKLVSSPEPDRENYNALSRTEEIENLNNLFLSSLNNLTNPKQKSAPLKVDIHSSPLDKTNGNVIKSAADVIQCEPEPTKGHGRRYVKREIRGLRSQRSRSDGVAKMIPNSSSTPIPGSSSSSSSISSGRASKYLSDPLRGAESWNVHQNLVSPSSDQRSGTDRTCTSEMAGGGPETDLSPMLGRRRRHASMGQDKFKEKQKAATNVVQQETGSDSPDANLLQSPLLIRRNSMTSTRGIVRNIEERLSASGSPVVGLSALDCSSRSKPCSRNNSLRKDRNSPSPQIRGDPDGCQLPLNITGQEGESIDSGKDSLIEKKGWLLRLGMHKDWYKHWFVLKNSTLSYFRDPSAENSGIMDGILDLGLVKEVHETTSDRNHAFSIITWDNKKQTLAALTPTVCSLWVESINTAANLGQHPLREESINSETNLRGQLEQPLRGESINKVANLRGQLEHSLSGESINNGTNLSHHPLPASAVHHFEEDDVSANLMLLPPFDQRSTKNDKKTLRDSGNTGGIILNTGDCLSVSSDDHSEYFSVVDEDDLASRSSSPKALPPSPPVNRTAISRVKQKARSRSNSRSRMSKRKLRSSSDIGPSNWEQAGGEAEDDGGNQSEGEASCRVNSCVTLPDVNKDSRTVADSDLVDHCHHGGEEDGGADGSSTRGNYRHLVDKYNYLRKRLDEHTCESNSNSSWTNISSVKSSLQTEKSLQLIAECRASLNRVQEAVSAQKNNLSGNSEMVVMNVDFNEEWKRFTDVCKELFTATRQWPGFVGLKDDDGAMAVGQKDIAELSAVVDKAKEEIRRLKKELKASQDNYDDLELCRFKLKQDSKSAAELHQCHMALMTARVDDLTSKLTSSERSLRMAKQRVAKLEARQERRRSSLKGKEAVSLSKEFEGKLSELEHKIGSIEMSLLNPMESMDLDSRLLKSTTPETGTSETSATNMLLRLHSLDFKVKTASSTAAELIPLSTPPNEIAVATTAGVTNIPAVQDVNLTVPQSIHSLEKPKICLQVKGCSTAHDDSSSGVGLFEDGIEHWSSLSVTTSMSDLHTIEPEEEIPGTMDECLNALTQKLDILLTWLQSSVRYIAEPNNAPILNGFESTRLNNPPEHVETAKKLEELLSNRGGMDESTNDVAFYLHLLQEASLAVRKCSEQPKFVEDNLKTTQSILLSRLKRASGKIKHIIDLESQPSNFLECVQKLLNLATPTFESVESKVTASEEVESRLRTQMELLTRLKNTKMEEASASSRNNNANSDNNGCVSKTTANEDVLLFEKDIHQPISDLEGELSQLEDQYRVNCCNDFDYAVNNHASTSEALSPMKYLLADLKDLKTELQTLESGVIERTVARIAIICAVNAILKAIQPNLLALEDSAGGHKWSVNVLVGMLEVLLVKWTSQLIFQTAEALADVLNTKENEVADLKATVRQMTEADRVRRSNPCSTCCELQKQVCRLQTDLRAYQRRVGQGGAPCERCRELHRRLEILSERHQMELASALNREREEHRSELQSRVTELVLSHEVEKNQEQEEMVKLKREAKAYEIRIEALKEEFREQVDGLRNAYEGQQDVVTMICGSEEEDNAVRERYRTEMEDLKGFCRRGLEAVETSHRMMLEELTERHRKELELLRVDKERALAEESQATQTALDVLRRTHREELNSTMLKLREEFNTELVLSTSDPKKLCHLDTIKKEILWLSEKYSLKCLEHTFLEEKLNSLGRQLQQSSQQVFSLLTHQLSSNEVQRPHQTQLGAEDYVEASPDRLRQLLELRERQLDAERTEREGLAHQLQKARNELVQLDVLRLKIEPKQFGSKRSQETEPEQPKSNIPSII